MHNIRLIQY